MEEKLNTISNKDLEEGRKINTLPDYKNGDPTGGGKPGAVKDATGHWTDQQIAENPIAYLKYLASRLENEHHADKIREIISEMEKVRERYLPDEYSKGRNR